MSQQLGIMVVVDTEAVVATQDLGEHMYLVDNGRWTGSEQEGTADLVSLIEGTRSSSQLDTQVINWLPLGINCPPRTVPQSSLLDMADKNILLDSSGGQKRPRFFSPLRMDATGITEDPETKDIYCSPYPEIQNIFGEAVSCGIIFPAQYGSPDLFSDGLYWSALVDTSRPGLYAYTLSMTIRYAKRENETMQQYALTLCHNAYIRVTDGINENGFYHMPSMLPV